NTATTQYDFLYSDMVTRRTAENDYSAIPLTFKHLFAQVGISFRVDDITTEEITLKRVYLANTMNVGKTAEIDFSTEDPEVTYTASSQGYYVTPVNLNITGFNSSSTPVDVLAQVQNGGRQYYYTWPMTEDELKGKIVVEYTLTKNSQGAAVNMDFVSVMNFPKGSKWKAGNKYQYVIAYMGGILKVEEQLLPWEYEESAGTDIPEPTMATWRGWDDATCTISGTNVTFKQNPNGTLKKIHGMLVVSSPSSCTLHINLSNHVSGDDIAYIIRDANGNDITTSGLTIGGANGIVPGATIDFYIEAVEAKRPAYGEAPLTSSLSFSIQSSDRDVSLDSELQRDGQYNIIIPALSE
ncbi:MAG: fimbrillin family protein, partial [Bacteroidales bacterium]|nr:fimbrillin family protein [Bacteroidales bacterium]